MNTAQTGSSGYVLTIGDTSCDVLIRIPAPGEEATEEPELIAGGTAGNTARALARLGLQSKLVTELGDDYYGRYVQRQIASAGVDTECVHIFAGYPTTQVIILLDNAGNPTANWPIADPRLFALVGVENISEELVASAAWLHTSGTSAMYANARAVMLHVMEHASRLGTPRSFDINLRLHREVGTPDGLRSLREAIRRADVIFGSDAEWRYLGESDDAETSVRSLLAGEGQMAVIRNGPGGAVGIHRSESIRSPAFRVPVRDALGAGDTFDAGFIAAFQEELPLVECLRWGNAAAALKLMQADGYRGGPTREQLEAFLGSNPEVIGRSDDRTDL